MKRRRWQIISSLQLKIIHEWAAILPANITNVYSTNAQLRSWRSKKQKKRNNEEVNLLETRRSTTTVHCTRLVHLASLVWQSLTEAGSRDSLSYRSHVEEPTTVANRNEDALF